MAVSREILLTTSDMYSESLLFLKAETKEDYNQKGTYYNKLSILDLAHDETIIVKTEADISGLEKMQLVKFAGFKYKVRGRSMGSTFADLQETFEAESIIVGKMLNVSNVKAEEKENHRN